MDLREIGLLTGEQEQHWYYMSKARVLQRSVADRAPDRILDVGAGSGFFSKMLLRTTSAQSAVCVDSGYANDWSETVNGKPIAFRRESPTGDADLVLLMDVLEHVHDDIGLVRSYADAARPGTRFIVSVPAFSWLWSRHDEVLQHHRRYTLSRTLRVLTAAGLSPVTGFYFLATLLPAVSVRRLWQRFGPAPAVPASELRMHHPLTNRVLAGICLAEAAVARHNRAFGLTAFGIAEKT
jgi:SAM-dependent methyltransferase